MSAAAPRPRGEPLLGGLATLGLGPLLLAQGVYVRRVVPRLPEPGGARDGVAGAGPSLRLLIVGDSAAAGVGVRHQEQALSGRLAAALAPHFRVSWSLIAQSGYTSGQIIERLRRVAPRRFDVALVSIGVNDATAGLGPRRWIAQQRRLVELLAERFGARHILLSALPPLHHFPALPQPLRWYLGQRALRLNRALAAFAAGERRCRMLAHHLPLDPAGMASDGFHPGAEVYRVWADAAAEAIRREMAAEAAPTGEA